jgi:hypothetical protein
MTSCSCEKAMHLESRVSVLTLVSLLSSGLILENSFNTSILPHLKRERITLSSKRFCTQFGPAASCPFY